MMGRSSVQRSGTRQLSQWEGGRSNDCLRGSRSIQTFKKLPTAAPRMARKIMVMAYSAIAWCFKFSYPWWGRLGGVTSTPLRLTHCQGGEPVQLSLLSSPFITTGVLSFVRLGSRENATGVSRAHPREESHLFATAAEGIAVHLRHESGFGPGIAHLGWVGAVSYPKEIGVHRVSHSRKWTQAIGIKHRLQP